MRRSPFWPRRPVTSRRGRGSRHPPETHLPHAGGVAGADSVGARRRQVNGRSGGPEVTDWEDSSACPAHLERLDQLRAGQRAREALLRREPQVGQLQPDRQPHRQPHQVPEGVGRRRERGARRGDRQGLRAARRASTSSSTTSSCRPSTPRPRRTIDIEEFVDLDEIDPIFYDTAYYVAPDKATIKPYALLARAMEETGKVGVARFVMRSKQYLCAVRPKDGKLMLSTMVYADEVNDPDEIREFEAVESVELSDKELTMAKQLVESLAGDFEPEQFEDTYRNKVLELIERKAAGRDRARRGARGRDGRQGRRPHGRPRGVGGGGEGRPQAAPARSPRRARPRPSRRRRRLASASPPDADVAAASSSTTVEIDGRQLKLSNLDKVLYPEMGFTKGEVIDYYARIAPVMVAHVGDRGVTLRRYPNGVDAGSRSSRSGARRTGRSGCRSRLGPGRPRAGRSSYCRLDCRPALVWSANMAALEIHAPMARCDDIETPTMVVFDLDPGAPADIADCCEVALSIRDVLDGLGLRGLAEDVGVEGAAALPAGQPPRTRPTSRRRPSPSPSPRRSSATTATGSRRRWSKALRPGQGLHRLEPEQPPQDDDRPVLAAGPPASDGVDAGHVGRGRGRRRRRRPTSCSRPPTCSPGSTTHGDLFADTVTLDQELPTPKL